MSKLRDDGERFLPDSMQGITALEHLHRYLFALQLAPGRRVLDIASGEGYGTALLAERSVAAVGVDIDAEAVDHATRKYGRPGRALEYRVGECARIPLEDDSVDLVVSFETIEHHNQHEEMLSEIKRVLNEDGIVVISTPDRREYSERTGFRNPFHVKELDADEFLQLMQRHFSHVALLRQRVMGGSWIVERVPASALDFFSLASGAEAAEEMPDAPYLLAVASNQPLPATRGGVLEQDLAHLAAPMVRDVYRQITSLIQTVALPGSRVLREQLQGAWYLTANPDLADAGLDRYQHWMTNGAAECRMPAADLPLLFRELVAERLGSTATAQEVAPLAGAVVAEVADRWQDAHSQSLQLSNQLASLLEGVAQELNEWVLRHTADESAQVKILDTLRDEVAEGLERLAQQQASEEAGRLALAAAWASAQADTRRQEQTHFLELSAAREEAARALAEIRSEDAQHRAQSESRWSSAQDAWHRETSWLKAQLAQESESRSRMESLHELKWAEEKRRQDKALATADRREADLTRQLAALSDAHRSERADLESRQAELVHQLESLREQHAARLATESQATERLELGLRFEVAALQSNVSSAYAKLAELSQSFSRERESLSQALERRSEALSLVQERLVAMQSSRTWRWTAPFRSLARMMLGAGGRAAGGDS